MHELVFVFVIGSIWGSFLAASEVRFARLLFWMNSISLNRHPNLLIKYYRLSLRNFFTAKSQCDHCKHTLLWYQNIPLLSFIFLKGKCWWCHKFINKNLFLVEIFSGIFFIIFFILFENVVTSFIFAVVFFSLLFLVSSFDIKYLLIPDVYSYSLLWVGILFLFFHNDGQNLYDGIFATIIAYLLLKLLSLVYLIGFGRSVLGEADPLLAGSLGVWLGWEYLPIFFLSASVIGFAWIFLTSSTTRESIWCQRIPFGPALCISAALIFIFKNFIN